VWKTIQVHIFLINKFGDGVGCGDITNIVVTLGTWVKYAWVKYACLGGGGRQLIALG